MTLAELVEEYMARRAPGWVVLDEPEALLCGVEAMRYCAAYMAIASLSRHDLLPGALAPGATAPAPPDVDPLSLPSVPVKDLGLLVGATALTVGEWAMIRPLFVLYLERENAQRLEASRAMGLEVFGRSVGEIAQDITMMESETIPAKTFSHALIEI